MKNITITFNESVIVIGYVVLIIAMAIIDSILETRFLRRKYFQDKRRK